MILAAPGRWFARRAPKLVAFFARGVVGEVAASWGFVGPRLVDLHCRTRQSRGGMAEWFKAPVLKTGERKLRGFESYSLRQTMLERWPSG